MKHILLTAAVSAAFLLAALGAGAHRRGALVGAAISGVTALGSLVAMSRFARGEGPRGVQRALAVMAVAFLARLLLLSAGVWFVVRTGESVVAFVIAFFVPYFVFVAIEGAFVHSLRRLPGSTA